MMCFERANNRKAGRRSKLECFDVVCAENKPEYTVNMFNRYGEKLSVVCKREGQKISKRRAGLKIYCEDPYKVCGSHTFCPKDCTQRYVGRFARPEQAF